MLFITMLTSSIEQRKDTSILRALGANRKTIFIINICQMLILAVIGVILGFILSHIVIAIIGNYIVTNYGIYMSGLVFQKEELIATYEGEKAAGLAVKDLIDAIGEVSYPESGSKIDAACGQLRSKEV